jgi:fatty-acyl-CoA synthase
MTSQDAIRKPGKVGRPILHTRVRLMDPETGKDVSVGETGELLFNGPHTCLGYWQNEKATQAAFFVDESGDQWFKSGDGAVMDEDGFYAIAGRFKDMIKSGGENIYAAEVETVFRQHEGVADAALIGAPDEKWGEVGVMIVLPKPGCQPPPEELLRFCDGRLARFKIPKKVILSESLPYSPYGKVIKAELRKKFITGFHR